MNIYTAIRRHLKETGQPPSMFGRAAIGDPSLIKELYNGRELRPSTVDKIRSYIEGYRS